MFDSNEKLNEVIQSDRLDIEFALNILINAAKSNWGSFSKVDKFLLGKALDTIQSYADNKEDIVIKFSHSN